ncbi:unnamed protein product [Nippostrongylus brasiliensis]|uniref:PMEI domain-containing protein n=1 Tax=Nippostrongylus brasiliensis TaxID=27835 RepID=A0A0N4YDA1_NIPBR|nr:unnamed protein product [Nippostrongylus brasiliensis]
MVSLRLISLATVLLISEAIADECKLRNKEICQLITDAHASNEDGLKLMKGDLVGNGKKALELADKLVVAVLNATEEEIIAALKEALKAELSAFVQVKADCFRLGKSYSGACDEILFEVSYVMGVLMHTIFEAHPDQQTKTKVDDILIGLIPSKLAHPASVYRIELHAAGKQVLELI